MPITILKNFINTFNFKNLSWNNLPEGFPKVDFDSLDSTEVSKLNSILTLWTLHQGKLREGKGNSPTSSRRLPFRIPIIEKTTRQAQSLQGYKASAYWQTASLLRDLIQLLLGNITNNQYRRKNQLEDAARSMVSTFEEGWARPTTKEFLDYIGFAQGSLAEVRGDTERLHTDGYLLTEREIIRKYGKLSEELKIPTPSRDFPYPPVNSRLNPSEYGKLRERILEFTGREVDPQSLSCELLTEFINKADYLSKKIVEGLQQKVILEEKQKLNDQINSHRDKNW